LQVLLHGVTTLLCGVLQQHRSCKRLPLFIVERC
jgi:hypothetical protein